jgi:hypothetical protein
VKFAIPGSLLGFFSGGFVGGRDVGLSNNGCSVCCGNVGVGNGVSDRDICNGLNNGFSSGFFDDRSGCGLFGALQEFSFPRGEGLNFGLRLGVALDETLGCGVRNDAGQQANGTDGVVVARDRVLNVVGVAVGVEDRDDGDTKLLGLVDCEVSS